MSAPTLKRYSILYWQESRCTIEITARSAKHAMSFVRRALECGVPLDAKVVHSGFAMLSTEVIDGRAVL